MRRLAGLTAILAAVLAVLSLLVVVSRLAGQQTGLPAAPALPDPGACVQPCWHGIQIGKTTFREAVALLQADQTRIMDVIQETFAQDDQTVVYWNLVVGKNAHWGAAIGTRTYATNLPVRSLELWPNSIVLGDALVAFGDPAALIVCPTNIMNISHIDSPVQTAGVTMRHVWAVHAFFSGSVEVVAYAYGDEPPDGFRLDAQMPVQAIMYNDPANGPVYRSDAVAWQGLARTYSSVARCETP